MLVFADEVTGMHRSLLGCRRAVRLQADRRDRAGVDDAPHIRLGGSGEHVARSLDIISEDFAALRPQAVVGGTVVKRIDAAHRSAQRLRIEEVAFDDLHREAGEVRAIASGTDEAADAMATGEQRANDVSTDEAGSPGDEVKIGQPRKFHAAMRSMSPGCFGSSRTTEASNPECIAQFWQGSSSRDSQ